MVTLAPHLERNRFLDPLAPTLHVGLCGLGIALGGRTVRNADFEHVLDTSDEWIRTRTGIESRHFATEIETTTTLAIDAAKRALANADIEPEEIDLIIVATATPDALTPSTAARVQHAIGARGAAAFDLSAACSGFLYATHVASGLIRAGAHHRALVIGAETLSRRLDPNDRTTRVLFGDGAGAAVLGGQGAIELAYSSVGADGSHADLIRVPNPAPCESKDRWISIDGRSVFKLAVRRMADEVERAFDHFGLSVRDVSRIIPHQANQRILDAVAETLGVDPDRIYSCVSDTANTSAASIPIALARSISERPVRPGEIIVTVGFGGGLTWGCQVWRA